MSRAPRGSISETAAPERPLAGSRSPALETMSRHAGTDEAQEEDQQHELQAPLDGGPPRRAPGRRTSAVTRGCSESASARMPPTHISHTSSSRAISSVHGEGSWSRWRPTTWSPTTAASAATSSALAASRAAAIKRAPPAATGRRRARGPASRHSASAGPRKAPRSTSRIVMPSAARRSIAARSSGSTRSRWRRAASSAAASSLGRRPGGRRREPHRRGPEARARPRCAPCGP